MANRLRDALIDAVDARDEAIKSAAETGAAMTRRAVAGIVVEAAKAGATEASVAAVAGSPEVQRAIKAALLLAAATADAQATKHARLILGAGKGKDEGPIARKHIEERRKARAGG